LISVNTAPGLTRHGDLKMAAKKKAKAKAMTKAKAKKAPAKKK
jgi:hypothetical protein